MRRSEKPGARARAKPSWACSRRQSKNGSPPHRAVKPPPVDAKQITLSGAAGHERPRIAEAVRKDLEAATGQQVTMVPLGKVKIERCDCPACKRRAAARPGTRNDREASP